MSRNNHHKNQLAYNIEDDWGNLEASFASLNEGQLIQICDEHGWSIKDHLAHIAHWEECLLMMFLDVPYEETMRIPWGKYQVFEDVNEDMRRQWAEFSPKVILNRLHRVQQQLMAKLSLLSEEDLQIPTNQFFSNLWFPKNDNFGLRKMTDFIQAHTDNHYRDHTTWINQMLASSQ